MVLPDSHRISRVLWYSGYPQSQLRFRVRAYHPVSELFPEHFRYPCWSLYEGPTTPNRRIYSVWPSPVSLATTAGVSFDFFSTRYWDVSLPRVGFRLPMYSVDNEQSSCSGFPIRTSSVQRLLSTSPKLFAASRVLHRLCAPRHPPSALSSLTMSYRPRLGVDASTSFPAPASSVPSGPLLPRRSFLAI